MAAKRSKAAAKTEAEGSTGAYVVFARRFRPQTFADVVGQQTVTHALRHALKSGRLAQAYLLTGPRGVGKTSLARIFAKALNCLAGSGPAEEPCNTCDACVSIQDGSALDVIEMDAATNRGIADVQKLRDSVGLSPSQLRTKLYIVDEVHMLTSEAWNAFLKTLEEPPPHVKFVFATTDPDKIPETILSRCQRFDLRRISLGEIVKRLQQICEADGIAAPVSALERIAGLAKGGLRDAESLLDLAVNLGEGQVDDAVVRQISGAAPDELLFSILHACAEGRVADALTQAGGALEAGADPDDLLVELVGRLRGTLLLQTCGGDSALLEGQSHLKASYAELAGKLSQDQVLMLVQLFSAARRQVRDVAQARLPLEMALIRASRVSDLVDLGKLVTAVEQGAAGGPSARAPSSAGARGDPRPNSAGRPAGTVESRPAAISNAPRAMPSNASAGGAPAVAGGGAEYPERWGEVLAGIRARSGGALLASALAHAWPIRLDGAGATLELGFTPAKAFYRESVERPDRQEALQAVLEGVFGRAVAVACVRGEERPANLGSGQTPAAAVANTPPATAPAEAAGRKAEPAREEEEFHDEGALPLPSAPAAESNAGDDDAGEAEDDADDLGPGGAHPVRPAAESINLPAAGPLVDAEAAKSHPLVELVVKRFRGRVADVRAANRRREP
ncbi:MAG: DNA polymerase III subunit gamma/tau [Planctomycetes bacterium]|nr:DNA polymerase III subunit gamma/tau [Planctomycetota bacterium]